MADFFDRRVVPEPILQFVRSCQTRVPCHFGGGAVLSGVHLSHRLSHDVDLVCHAREDVRSLLQELPGIAVELATDTSIMIDAGNFVRARLGLGTDVDLVFEATPDLQAASTVEGVLVESLQDLRASKLTCLLSRSEPRDLVDLLFLDRAGFPPEADLALALKKDAGIDPGALAWLLRQFPVSPLPVMIQPLTEEELRRFRDALCERMRRIAIPPDGA